MNTLSPIIRKKAELVSIVCGCTGGILANIERSNAVVLWIVLASTVAGAVGNVTADAGDDPGLRPRAGIRAGVLTAIIAGAVAVLAVTIQSRLGGFVVVLPALLAIPPGAFFGLLGSLLISMIQNPQVRPLGPADTSARGRPSALLIAILLGSITGYLSPLIALYLPQPAPRIANSPVVVASPTPKPTPTPVPTPRPKPWRYEAPDGFAEAHPSQLNVLKEVSLGTFEPPFRFAFARDGHTLAFARSNSAITVLDLNEPETTASFTVPETPERFGFSPDGKRLFCITTSAQKFVLSKDRTLRLPLPKDPLSGPVDWADDSRVLFEKVSLDLNTLQVSPAPKDRPSSKPASHPNFRLRTDERLIAVHDSRLETEKRYILADARRDYFILTPAKGKSAFLSPDGTKLLDVRDRELVVLYFELRPSRELKLTANMGAAPPAAIADALKAGKIGALLCSPIVNPLNDRPVAADLSRIKAILAVESWEGPTATLRVREDYGMSVQSSDTVGLLSDSTQGRNPDMEAFENWWSVVRDVTPSIAPDVIAAAESAPPRPDEPPKKSQPAVEPPTLTEVTAILRTFIQAHHAKSSRGDIEGVVADYADRVDHFDKNIVDRDFIHKEETAYHAPGYRISEQISTPLAICFRDNGEYEVSYTIAYERTRPDGRWARGLADTILRIAITPNGPRINYQRATQRNQQKGP